MASRATADAARVFACGVPMAHDEWSVDDIYRHLVGLRGPQRALPELVTALHSGRLLLTMRVHDIYDGRVTWRRELAAHWNLGVALVDGKAKLVVTRALVGFNESTFTIPGWRVLRLWPKSPSVKAENECWAWLEVLAKGHPDRPPKPNRSCGRKPSGGGRGSPSAPSIADGGASSKRAPAGRALGARSDKSLHPRR
jgi:hypothetical protein